MSKNRARDLFDSSIAEQRTGVLTVTVGSDSFRLSIDPESITVLDYKGRRGLKITDVLIFEGVASEADLDLALKEAKQKKKPIEQVLKEFGLIDLDLMPAINERLVIEEIVALLEDADDAEFESTEDAAADAGSSSNRGVVASVEGVLGFLTKIEETAARFRKIADRSDIVALTESQDVILANEKITGFVRTVCKLVDGKSTVKSILEVCPLPSHHVIRTLLSIADGGALQQLNIKDLRRQAAEAEEAGRYDDAYSLFQAAHELKKSDTEILEKLAMIAEIVEDKAGIANYNSLLALHAITSRNDQLAAKCYERVARFDSHHREAHEFLFKQASHQEMAGEMIKIGRELIRIYIEQREFEQAKQTAKRCLKYAPDDLRILDALAKTYATCNENSEAVAIYEQIMALMLRRGEKQEAMNILLTIRRLAPDREDIKKKIESIHSAERRRSIIRWTLVAMAPVFIVVIGLGLLFKANKDAAVRAHDNMVVRVKTTMQSSKTEDLSKTLAEITKHLELYPGDSDIEELAEQINVRIYDLESRAERERNTASDQAAQLLDRAIDAEIGPPPDFASADKLLHEANDLVPPENLELRQQIGTAMTRVAQGLRLEIEQKITQLRDRLDDYMAKNDISGARTTLEEIRPYAEKYDLARQIIREREKTLSLASTTILDRLFKEAVNQLISGDFEGSEVKFLELRTLAESDAKLVAKVDEKLKEIDGMKEAAFSLLRDAERAVAAGEMELALGLYRQLHSEYRKSSAAQEIKIPVTLDSNVDRADLVTPTENLKDVELPRTFILGVDENMLIKVERKGYESAQVELHGTFESFATFADLKRLPTWTIAIDGSMARRPTVQGETVVLTSTKSSMHAVDPKGKSRWPAPYTLGGITGFSTTPCIVNDIVITALTSSEIIGVNLATGKNVFTTPTPKKCRGSPAASSDGASVYFGCDDGSLIVLDARSGAIKKSIPIDSPICGDLLVADGKIFFGAEDDKLHAITEGGFASVFEYQTGSDIVARPVVAGSIIVVGSRDSHVYSLTTAGEERWKTKVSGPILGDLGLTADKVYAATSGAEGRLHALSLADGRDLFTSGALSPVPGGVVCVGDRVYLGSEDSRIHVFQHGMEGELWTLKVNGKITTAPTVFGNLVVFGTSGNQVLAFEE